MAERPDFWGIPKPWPYLVYALIFISAGIMLYRFYREFAAWHRLGRPIGKIDQPLARLWHMIKHGLFQVKLFKDPYGGIMHVLIAWSFFALFAGTPIGILNGYIFKGFLKGTIFLIFKLIMDLAFFTYFIGFGMAAYRRLVLKPEKLTLEPAFNRTLLMLSAIVLTGPMIEGARLAVEQPDYGWWMPVGWIAAKLWLATGLTDAGLELAHRIVYVTHMGLVCLAFITLPVEKLKHIVTTPLNQFFARLRPLGRLSRLREDAQGAYQFSDHLEDLTWVQLLNFEACVECGRCQEVCPAYAIGQPLSPKQFILDLRRALRDNLNGHEPKTEKESRLLVGRIIKDETLWACTTCAACADVCPAFINHVELVVDFRRALINEGRVDSMLQDALAKLSRYGNSFGQSARKRAAWTKTLDFEVKDATEEPVEYLWFLGDYTALNPMIEEIGIKTAQVFHHAGVDFGMLFKAEYNAANDIRRVGEEGLFQYFVEKNCEAFAQSEFSAIVTTDPHSLNTIKNEYPAEALNGRPVLHYTELLDQLIRAGKLKFKKKLNYRVTYHDPCYLGRYNGIYDAPRRVIEATGCELVEMSRNRDRTFCCKGGGGLMWVEEIRHEGPRPSELRVREAADLPQVSRLVLACPNDSTMYKDAVKTTGLEEQIMVVDIIDLVHEALMLDQEGQNIDITPPLSIEYAA